MSHASFELNFSGKNFAKSFKFELNFSDNSVPRNNFRYLSTNSKSLSVQKNMDCESESEKENDKKSSDKTSRKQGREKNLKL